ncbi:hypothetical protein MMC19_003709 [Ptychographa xylographoides]|nr:hypothetical protein [Ptychographa xylographoides]
MATDPTPCPQTLKVLCFGDSLTAGYSTWGSRFHPYAAHLKSTLQGTFPSTSIEIVVEGLSGAQVRAQYTGRLNRACRDAGEEPYDWVVVLGGTNDLGRGGKPEEIFEGLVWSIALETGANVLALTVTEAAVRDGSLMRRRDALNALIAEHEADRFYCMDLCYAVPYFAMEEETRDTIWSDGLHLTAEGYNMMGDAIGAYMAELLPTLKDVKNVKAVKAEQEKVVDG